MTTIEGTREVNIKSGRTTDEDTLYEIVLDVKGSRDVIAERFVKVGDREAQYVESVRGPPHKEYGLISAQQVEGPHETGVRDLLRESTIRTVTDSGGKIIGTLTINLE